MDWPYPRFPTTLASPWRRHDALRSLLCRCDHHRCNEGGLVGWIKAGGHGCGCSMDRKHRCFHDFRDPFRCLSFDSTWIVFFLRSRCAPLLPPTPLVWGGCFAPLLSPSHPGRLPRRRSYLSPWFVLAPGAARSGGNAPRGSTSSPPRLGLGSRARTTIGFLGTDFSEGSILASTLDQARWTLLRPPPCVLRLRPGNQRRSAASHVPPSPPERRHPPPPAIPCRRFASPFHLT